MSAYRLPRLTMAELVEIDDFIEHHQSVITAHEVSVINALISDYHRRRTIESRRKIKTFLLFLRRSIVPTPVRLTRRMMMPKRTDSQLTNTTTDSDTSMTPIHRRPCHARIQRFKNNNKTRRQSMPRMGVRICDRLATPIAKKSFGRRQVTFMTPQHERRY